MGWKAESVGAHPRLQRAAVFFVTTVLAGLCLHTGAHGQQTAPVNPGSAPHSVTDSEPALALQYQAFHELAPGGGLVFGSVHNIQANVPPENVVAFFEAAYEYGGYPISV